MHFSLSPSITTSSTSQHCPGGDPAPRSGPRPGYLRGRRALPLGAGRRARRGPARRAGRTPGAPSSPSPHSPACALPGPRRQGRGAKGPLLPRNSDLHGRSNAGGEPKSRGLGTGRPGARLRGSSRAPAPYLLKDTGPGGKRRSGPSDPEGGEGERARARGPAPVAARGEARRARASCRGAARRPDPGWERGRRHKAAASGAMNRAFSQCVVWAWPPRVRVRGCGPARPKPAGVTQGRARALPAASECPGSAAIPRGRG